MSEPNPSDLSSLLDAAAKEVSGAAKTHERARAQLRKPGRRLPVAELVAVVLGLGGLVSVYGVWTHYAGPTTSQVADDLGQALDLARESIEAVRKATGTLPEALPNASLAAVVYYEVRNDKYQLRATTGNADVTIDWDGTKTIGKGNRQ